MAISCYYSLNDCHLKYLQDNHLLLILIESISVNYVIK